MGKLHGKVAVVTGGSTGIGFATAKRFVDEGAFVFITGRRQKGARRGREGDRQQRRRRSGGRSLNCRTSIASTKTVKAKGKIDVLVANAGIGEFAPLASLTEEHFDKLFDLNVKGTVFTVQKALTLMNDGGLDRSHRLRRERQRHACLRYLRRDQGGSSQSGANLDHGAERPSHSLQRPKPRSESRRHWWIYSHRKPLRGS